MDYANVAELTSLPSTKNLIWQITRKSNGPYFPPLHAFCKVWLKFDENCGSSGLSKILISGILQSYQMTPNSTKRIGHKKYLTYAPCRTTSPINLHLFHSTISHFQDIGYLALLDSYSMGLLSVVRPCCNWGIPS